MRRNRQDVRINDLENRVKFLEQVVNNLRVIVGSGVSIPYKTTYYDTYQQQFIPTMASKSMSYNEIIFSLLKYFNLKLHYCEPTPESVEIIKLEDVVSKEG